MKSIFSIVTVVSAGAAALLLLCSCASSERMMRMSGALSDYEPPRSERIKSFHSVPSRRTLDPLGGLDQSLINVWPFFFRNAAYYSVLWPMIDRDPYGFAVRPFYNQEGNEYAVLFPLAAWNPVNGDGWAANAFWSPRRFGFFPLFLYANDRRFSYYGPVWRNHDNWGFFPLTRLGDGLNYALLGWWNEQNWGIFPLARFGNGLNYALLGWWNKRNWGIFPLARFGDGLNYALLGWRNEQNWGIFPLARFGVGTNYALLGWWGENSWGIFPLCNVDQDGGYVLNCFWSNDNYGKMRKFAGFPMALWQRDGLNYALLWYGGRKVDGEAVSWPYWGIAPGLLHVSNDFSMAMLAWWQRDDAGTLESGGFFPLARFSRNLNYVGPAWWDHDAQGELDSGGFFPLARFSGNLNYVGPVWWDRAGDEDCGFFPLARFRSSGNQYIFPLYNVWDGGKGFFSPLAGWYRGGHEKWLSVLGPLFVNSWKQNQDDCGGGYWNRIKESDFTLIGGLGFRGGSDSYRLPVDGLDAATLQEKFWTRYRPLVWKKLAELGMDSRPETHADFKKLYPQLAAKRVIDRSTYWGLAPLFYTGSGPDEFWWGAGGVLAFYQRTPAQSTTWALTPLVFLSEEKRNQRRLYPDSLNLATPFLETRRVVLTLLSGDTRKVYYRQSPETRILAELEELGYRFGDRQLTQAPGFYRYLRFRADQLLRQLDASLTLPAEVCDGDSMRDYLEQLAKKYQFSTRQERDCFLLPFYFYRSNREQDAWLLPALLSGFGREGWLSLPLLSGCLTEGRKTTFGYPFFAYLGTRMSDNPEFRVMERSALAGAKTQDNLASEADTYGLFCSRSTERFLVPVRVGEAAALDELFFVLREFIREQLRYDTRQQELAGQWAALRNSDPSLTDLDKLSAWLKRHANARTGTEPALFHQAISALQSGEREQNTLRRRLDGKQQRMAKLLATLALASPAAVPSDVAAARQLLERLRLEAVTPATVERISSGVWNQERIGANRRWNVLWFLADGEQQDGSERTSVLKYLYRFRRDGARSDRLIFPFISERRDGEDYQFNFLHRIFARYREKGKSGGYLFYIPF